MDTQHFPILILVARPAAGKSEIIHYLKYISAEQRVRRFHIGPFTELDDFPMLWAWFEEDHILENELNFRRLHTDANGYFIDGILWHLLIRRLSLDYNKLLRDAPDFHDTNTVIIEFARGAAHGGYNEAFQHLSGDILSQAAVLYIDVTFEESVRKNRRRFNPDRADSILEHGLPDEKMERLYKEDDFHTFSAADPAYLHIKGYQVPYVIFENHDDVTTPGGEPLAQRLEQRLAQLWERYTKRP